MIIYDPGVWSLAFAFSLKGSVFPKAVMWSAPCSVVAVVLHTIFHSSEQAMMVAGAGDVATDIMSGFMFILGFLVVFRSQQAYSRWWEGGTLLQQLRGEWFNSYSCLVAFCTSSKEKREEVIIFQHTIVRLFSLLYGCALQQVCTLEEKKFELIDIKGLDEQSLRFLQESPDRCEVVLQWIQRLIVESEAAGILKIAPPILSRVFNELGNGIVNLNNARKITEFPIPFPLAQMITVMLLFHGCVIPVICAATVETVYWCFVITFVVTFSYWSINYIAVELEMPFGDDWNDLPLYEMQQDMNGSLRTLIHERAQRVPYFTFNREMHEPMHLRVVDFQKDLVDFDEVVVEDFARQDSGGACNVQNGQGGGKSDKVEAPQARQESPVAADAGSQQVLRMEQKVVSAIDKRRTRRDAMKGSGTWNNPQPAGFAPSSSSCAPTPYKVRDNEIEAVSSSGGGVLDVVGSGSTPSSQALAGNAAGGRETEAGLPVGGGREAGPGPSNGVGGGLVDGKDRVHAAASALSGSGPHASGGVSGCAGVGLAPPHGMKGVSLDPDGGVQVRDIGEIFPADGGVGLSPSNGTGGDYGMVLEKSSVRSHSSEEWNIAHELETIQSAPSFGCDGQSIVAPAFGASHSYISPQEAAFDQRVGPFRRQDLSNSGGSSASTGLKAH